MLYTFYSILGIASGYTIDGYAFTKSEAFSHLSSLRTIEESLMYGNGLNGLNGEQTLFSNEQYTLMDSTACSFWDEVSKVRSLK